MYYHAGEPGPGTRPEPGSRGREPGTGAGEDPPGSGPGPEAEPGRSDAIMPGMTINFPPEARRPGAERPPVCSQGGAFPRAGASSPSPHFHVSSTSNRGAPSPHHPVCLPTSLRLTFPPLSCSGFRFYAPAWWYWWWWYGGGVLVEWWVDGRRGGGRRVGEW